MEARKRILVVEDNPSDQFLALRAFQQWQLDDLVMFVRDGASALDYLFCTGPFAGRSPNDLPDLVILDLSLPGLNGVEVLDRIRAERRTHLIPVVVFSGSISRRDVLASYLSGANSFVQKPADFASFSEVLRQIWHYWSAISTPPSLANDETDANR